MSRPDPNGCRDCGLPDCRLSALLDKPMTKRTLEDWDEIREARRQCSARPAVDWQAAYRALAAERAASPPQEVVEAAEEVTRLAGQRARIAAHINSGGQDGMDTLISADERVWSLAVVLAEWLLKGGGK